MSQLGHCISQRLREVLESRPVVPAQQAQAALAACGFRAPPRLRIPERVRQEASALHPALRFQSSSSRELETTILPTIPRSACREQIYV
jgi:hypothetical protein